MTSALLPATPDLMTMLCRIGAGMRAAVPSGLFKQFLLIGALCPQFGALLRAWLFVEERLAAGLPTDEADLLDDDGDADLRSGWLSQEGPVWRWRQVTRSGIVLVIPVLWFVARDTWDRLPPRLGRVPARSSVRCLFRSPLLFAAWFFCLGRVAESNCAVFVPVNQR